MSDRMEENEAFSSRSVPLLPDHHSISQTLMHLPGSQRAVLNAALECRPVLYSVSKIYSDLQLYKFFSSSCFQKHLIRRKKHHYTFPDLRPRPFTRGGVKDNFVLDTFLHFFEQKK